MSTKKTIAKSFTVSTIEDGVSVQAQYAPNANPTSGQIHTVWQNGDLYMRTRESDESAWSSWHKIVGESGDETDYTFNISKEKTSSSATTAPSNCYYNTWQDAPIAPTSTYPYLWMKVVKKTWNESTQSYDSGTPSYARITGETGDSAPIAYATPEKVTIPCNTDGSVASQITQFITFGMRVGSNDATSIRVDNPTSTPTGVSWSATQAAQGNLTISTSASASGMANGVTFKVTGTYGGKDYVSYVTVALIGSTQGEQGERGKVGRFFYFGGTFNAADTTQTFIVNDAQAPYFEHSETVTTQSGTTTIKRYHVFNYDTNGTYTMAQMWAIRNNWNYKPWESMTNDFKYIITEALFGSYAHLGSWIFNGDYMLSQAGVDGTENYTQFTGEGSTWQPNLYMNAKTGKLVANSGVIGGFTINASQIKSSNSNIILNSDGSAKIGGFEVATNATASLKSTLTVGNTTSQRIEIIPFASNKVGSGTIDFINADSDKVLKIGFYNDNYGSIDFYSPATDQNPEKSEVSVRSNYLQIYSENTDNRKESYITMLTSTNNAYSQYTFDDKVNKMFLTSGVEGGTLMLRAHKQNGSSAWPEYNYMSSPDDLSKGSVQVMSLGSLKSIFDSTYYSDRLSKLSVLIIRNNIQ